jgi:hypothetical protein
LAGVSQRDAEFCDRTRHCFCGVLLLMPTFLISLLPLTLQCYQPFLCHLSCMQRHVSFVQQCICGVEQRRDLDSPPAAAVSNSHVSFENETTHGNVSVQPQTLKNCQLDTNSPSFREAMERTRLQVQELDERLEQVSLGGGSEAVTRHHSRRQGLASGTH